MKLKNLTVPIIVVVLLLLWQSSVTVISPEELTRTRQSSIEQRLLKVPADQRERISLADLPERHGRDNSFNDGWKRPMHLEVHANLATVTSYGRDGRPGGLLEDADIVTTVDLSAAEIYR